MSYLEYREEKTPTKTIQSVATAPTVITSKDVDPLCRHVRGRPSSCRESQD